MNVLIAGGGGREHAIGHKVNQSSKLDKLFFMPGNAGTAALGVNLNGNPEKFEDVKQHLLKHDIDMLVVGPEAPLVAGIADFIANDEELKHVMVIGPKKAAARLEGSKDFAKQFMNRHNIPTAAHQTFGSGDYDKAVDFLKTLKPPYVLKADGLAAGKGVLIINGFEKACNELKEMLAGKFGEASGSVVIEEFLTGIELSVFVLTDGKDYVLLPEAKDYKRIKEGDKGLNTGGMGAVSPVAFADSTFMKKVKSRIIEPTLTGLVKDKMPYTGFIFFGLMNVNGDPYVIEYNVRMGDPETEAVLPRLKGDLLELFEGAAKGDLVRCKYSHNSDYAVTVMLVSKGYPEAYEKGKEITGLSEAAKKHLVFHAGTKESNGKVVSNGGRVIAVTGMAGSLDDAISCTYDGVARVEFEGVTYRTDIGRDLR